MCEHAQHWLQVRGENHDWIIKYLCIRNLARSFEKSSVIFYTRLSNELVCTSLILSNLYHLLHFAESLAKPSQTDQESENLFIQNGKMPSFFVGIRKFNSFFWKSASFNLYSSLCKLVAYLNIPDWEQCPPPALTVDIKQQHASAWSELQTACSHSCLANLVTSTDIIFGEKLVFGFTCEHILPLMRMLENELKPNYFWD